MTTNVRTSPSHSHGARALTLAAALATTLSLVACDEDDLAPPNPAVEQQLQQVLDGSVAKPEVFLPGAVVHYHEPGHRRWSGAAGLGETAGGVALRPNDKFRVGSVLKPFLATLTLQYVEKGTLSLEDRLPALLPASITAHIANADQITLRMLLGHTSGIPDWVTDEVVGQIVANPNHVWTPEETVAIAGALPPLFPPGSAWHYSNTNYTLVGMVLDRIGGKSWRAQAQERIFDRLGLNDSSLPEPGAGELVGPFAHGYQQISGHVMDLSGIDPSMAGAAGGHALVTTAEDLGRFIEALLGGHLFANPQTLVTMKTMVEAPHESGLPHRYGLGLEEFTMPDGNVVIGHSGTTAGYAVMMFRIPARDITLVTAVNTADLFANAQQVFMPALGVLSPKVQ